MPRSLDTESDAEAVQLGLYRRMTPARRVAIGIQMSLDARATVLAGIRARHRDYDDGTAR